MNAKQTPQTLAPTRASIIAMLTVLALIDCTPSAGYRAAPLNSPQQSVAAPHSVQPSSGNVQPSIPAAAVPGAPRDAGATACSRDEDCVPATCCHARTCVDHSVPPNCREVMCTMDCQPGTIDCGGGCACQAGFCVARFAPRR